MKTSSEQYRVLLESYLGRASWVPWAFHNLGCFNRTLTECARNGVGIDRAFVIACEVMTKILFEQRPIDIGGPYLAGVKDGIAIPQR